MTKVQGVYMYIYICVYTCTYMYDWFLATLSGWCQVSLHQETPYIPSKKPHTPSTNCAISQYQNVSNTITASHSRRVHIYMYIYTCIYVYICCSVLWRCGACCSVVQRSRTKTVRHITQTKGLCEPTYVHQSTYASLNRLQRDRASKPCGMLHTQTSLHVFQKEPICTDICTCYS